MIQERISARYLSAIQLPMHEAIQVIEKLQEEVDGLNDKIELIADGLPLFLDMHSTSVYLSYNQYSRSAKLLQIVEAIRDFASRNDNRLPESLSDLELPLPLDPFTNQPAEYELNDGVATLSWPEIPNIAEQPKHVRSYELMMKE